MCILGIDYGDKRIGVAGCDLLKLFAFGLEIIYRKAPDKFFHEDKCLLRIIKQREVNKIIIGFPKKLNNTCGIQCEKVLFYKKHLDELLREKNIKIVLWDERLSTVGAKKKLLEAGLNIYKQKKIIDKIAAVFILQGYLDYLKMTEEK